MGAPGRRSRSLGSVSRVWSKMKVVFIFVCFDICLYVLFTLNWWHILKFSEAVLISFHYFRDWELYPIQLFFLWLYAL